MFERCDNCGKRIVFNGVHTRDGLFCSRECQRFARRSDFCRHCYEETTDIGAGGTTTVNGIGTRLFGSGGRCDICNSVIQTKYFCFIFPLIPMGKYRVLYASPTSYLSRKLVYGPARDYDDDYDDYDDDHEEVLALDPVDEYDRPPQYGSPDTPPPYYDDRRPSPPRRRPRRREVCTACGSCEEPILRSRIGVGGWVTFVVLLFFCLPICWLGLFIKDSYYGCYDCGAEVYH